MAKNWQLIQFFQKKSEVRILIVGHEKGIKKNG
jgi:hypothetical protein